MTAGKRIRVLEMIDEAGIGGGQMHVRMLAKHLDPELFDVSIACEPEGYLVDEAKKLGVMTYPLTMGNAPNPKTLAAAVRTLQRYDGEILHTHGGTAGAWGRLAAVVAGKPRTRIHTYHGLHYLSKFHSAPVWFRWADKLLLRTTNRVICVCASDYNKALNAGVATRDKAVVIRNGIEMERFVTKANAAMIRQRFNVSPSDVLFVNIGRLHMQKGQRYLLEAFAEVHKSYAHARLWLIGDGELLSLLEDTARTLGISAVVSFLGARSDVEDLLPAADAFVLSSLWEGQPLSLMEAMAAGVPVVATRIDGVTEMLEDNVSALLVPPQDPTALSDAMNRLVDDRVLKDRLSLAGRRTILEQYSADRMVRETSMLYQSLMEESNSKAG